MLPCGIIIIYFNKFNYHIYYHYFNLFCKDPGLRWSSENISVCLALSHGALHCLTCLSVQPQWNTDPARMAAAANAIAGSIDSRHLSEEHLLLPKEIDAKETYRTSSVLLYTPQTKMLFWVSQLQDPSRAEEGRRCLCSKLLQSLKSWCSCNSRLKKFSTSLARLVMVST